MLYYSIYSTKRLLRNANNKRTLMKRIDCALQEDFHKTTQQIKLKQPNGALIEITNGCNLSCVMCNTKMSKRHVGFRLTIIYCRAIMWLAATLFKRRGIA